MLRQDCARHTLPVIPAIGYNCAMEMYARYHGEWDTGTQAYKSQKLDTASSDKRRFESQGIGQSMLEKWYAWKVTKRLKNTRQNWCMFYPPSTDLMQAQYRAKVGSNVLKSFSSNAEATCQPSSQCGLDVMSQCGTSDGVAHILCVSTNCQVKF